MMSRRFQWQLPKMKRIFVEEYYHRLPDQQLSVSAMNILLKKLKVVFLQEDGSVAWGSVSYQ